MSEFQETSPAGGGMAGERDSGDEAPQATDRRSAAQKEGRPFDVIDGGAASEPFSLDHLPAVSAYLRRIGGEAVNFKTATVTEIDARGYPKCIGYVEFGAKGQVAAFKDAEPPTPDEQRDICANFEGVEFPKLKLLDAIADPPPGVRLGDPNVFECHDFNGKIVMLHQRYEKQDGGKGFIPWTRWSDAKWRKMQPDVLPFYGLPGGENATTLFIHEGAKAARRLKARIAGEDKSRFPWLENVRWGHHIGWLGGVHAFEQSDWEGLKRWIQRVGIKRVVVICDNDRGGKDVTRKISKALRMPLSVIMFDDRFPPTFDLGDDMPASFYEERAGELICHAPSWEELSRPGTWATDQVPSDRPGRPAYSLRDDFISECYVSVTPPRIIWGGRDYAPSEFNVAVRPYSDVEDTARLLYRRPSVVLDGFTYDPANDRGVVATDSGMRFNAHKRSRIKRKRGNPLPFLRYVTHLIPHKGDRLELLRWVATLIACPGTRMHYAPLLTSETQGVGKTTLAEHILAPLVGNDNVSSPNEADVTESSFNGWLAYKRLVIINELYAGDSRRVSNKLKPLITDKKVRVNVKFQPEYEIECWAHFYACSNAKVPLLMDIKDRRWFIPEVTERIRPREFWARLHEWLAGDGLEIIHQWAFDFIAKHGPVRTGDRAPASARKAAMIADSVPEGRRLIADLGDALMELACAPTPVRVMVTISDVREWLASQMGITGSDKRLPGDRAIRDGLATAGLLIRAGDDKVWIGKLKKAVALNFTPEAGTKWPDIVRSHLKTMTDLGIGDAF